MESPKSSIAGKAEVPSKNRANFWTDWSAPIFALAPMEDVTDTVFRELLLGISNPDRLQILYTEFTNVDGMNHPVGKTKVGQRLIVRPNEKRLLRETGIKLVAQIWGSDPEVFYKIVKEISAGDDFDGIDINMGCPDKNVVKSGACSALIGQPDLAKEIILATQEATHLPVSVKTRTGIHEHITETWLTNLLETKPAAIILHGRTQKQQSDNLADWAEIKKAVHLRDQSGLSCAVLGNGDVFSYQQGLDRIQETGVNGVMIGRGIFHNPWFFSSELAERSRQEKLDLLLKHITLFRAQWEGEKSLYTIKRYIKIYANGFSGAVKLRGRLMQTRTFDELVRDLKKAMD